MDKFKELEQLYEAGFPGYEAIEAWGRALVAEACREKDKALRLGISGCGCQNSLDEPLCEVCQKQQAALSTGAGAKS
jgi:hypothetical protein